MAISLKKRISLHTIIRLNAIIVLKTIMGLLTVLLISSFFLFSYLTNKVTQADISYSQLQLLDTLSYFLPEKSKTRLTNLLATNNRQAWLHLAKLYVDHQPSQHPALAFELGQYYLANNNQLAAQFYLNKAVSYQHQAARIILAELYYKTFEQSKYAKQDSYLKRDHYLKQEKQQQLAQLEKIKALLLPISHNLTALIWLYKIALIEGDIEFIAQYQQQLQQLDDTGFYQAINEFGVFSESISTTSYAKHCVLKIQFIASDFSGFQQGKKLIQQFKKQPLAKILCLQTPIYIPKHVLACQHALNKAISCNSAALAAYLPIFSKNSRYLAIIVEQGGAKTDNGIVYLDKQDNIDVLVHEISHLLGFIDEYPLPNNHQTCTQVQQQMYAHNIVTLTAEYKGDQKTLRQQLISQLPWGHLIKATTPIFSQTAKGWQLGTPLSFKNEVGVFQANTCNKQNVKAYKPVFQRTKLEYFELAFPKPYYQLLFAEPKRFLMPSFHYNISRDLADQGDIEQAKKVLKQTLFH